MFLICTQSPDVCCSQSQVLPTRYPSGSFQWQAGLGDGHGATVVSTLAISLGILEAGLPDSYQPMTRTTSLGPRQGSSWGGQHQLRTLLEAGIIIQ